MEVHRQGENPSGRIEEDELFQRSLTQLAEGRLAQAMESILQLGQRYGDTREVLELLQEARFEADRTEEADEEPSTPMGLPTVAPNSVDIEQDTLGEETVEASGIADDLLYRESLTQLDEGRLEQAVESILQLRQRYGDAPEVLALLQEASFQADWAEGKDEEPPALIGLPAVAQDGVGTDQDTLEEDTVEVGRIEDDLLYRESLTQLEEGRLEQAMASILQLRQRYGDIPEVLVLLQKASFQADWTEGQHDEPPALIGLPALAQDGADVEQDTSEEEPVQVGAIEDDLLYRESVAQLQRGDWEKATEAILELGRRHGNTTEVQSLLREVSFKAALDQEPVALRPPSAWGRLWGQWAGLAKWVLPAVLILAVGGVFLATSLRPVAPAPDPVEQAEDQAAQLHQQAQFYLASRQYDEAIETFESILAESPTDAAALEGIARAEQRQQIEALYDKALVLLEDRQWESALRVMDEIEALDPDYTGLAEERAVAEDQLELASSFAAAEAAYAASEWQEALQAYERVQEVDRNYEKTVVSEHLFDTYVHRGRELVDESSGSVVKVELASQLFTAALAIHPGQADVVRERDLAAAYIEGREAYDTGDWLRAVDTLNWLYNIRPDYCAKSSLLLYDASLRAGETYEAQGDLELAMTQYQRATEIQGVDHSQAQARIAALNPEPTPTRVIVPVSSGESSGEANPSTVPGPSWPYDYAFMGGRPNCGRTGVMGVIKDRGSLPVNGIQVRLTDLNGSVWVSGASNDDGEYEIVVANAPLAQTWSIGLVKDDQRLSPIYSFRTSLGCENGLQEYKIDWQQANE